MKANRIFLVVTALFLSGCAAGCRDDEVLSQMIAKNAELQQSLHEERVMVSRQRDQLEKDRKTLAAQRHRAPIIAAAITHVGMTVACLMPLLVCWWLLRQYLDVPQDQIIADAIILDLVADKPLLLPSSPPDQRLIPHAATDDDTENVNI